MINAVAGVEVWGFGNKRGFSQDDGWISGDLALCTPKPPIPGYYHRAPAVTISARLPFIGFNASEPKQRAYFAHGLAWCDAIPSNIFVSMQSVMGGAQIFNPNAGIVPLTGKTSFHLETQRNEAAYLSSIDFDGDDIKDPASYLKYDEVEKTYTPLNENDSASATHVGIYFTTGVKADPDTSLAIPSIIRAVDRTPQYLDKGLLKTINTVDLAQTDLYVFRVSSGQLITRHKGIEQGTFDDDHTQGGTFNNAFNFEFAIRGPDDYWAQFTPYSDYVSWASATKVTEPFQKENADHVRPGEQLQLIAINRASGYIGSVKFTSKQVGVGGDINNALDSIIMRPPNLKIWAERVHEIKQGKQVAGEEESTNIIGNEGITLEDDLAVSIHTQWLDYNGLPLPAELGDYGYTARIAKITSTPTPNVDALKQNSSNASL